MPNRDIGICGSVLDPEIPNIDMAGLGTCQHPPNLLKFDGAFVVLFKETLGQNIPLRHKEQLHPQGVGQVVACTDNLGLCGALGHQLLFARLAGEATSAKRNHSCGSSCWGETQKQRPPRSAFCPDRRRQGLVVSLIRHS
jgi:hypothetical protein